MGLGLLISLVVTVTPAHAAALTLGADPTTLTVGETTTLTATVDVEAASLQLEQKAAGATEFSPVGDPVTAVASGELWQAQWVQKPKRSTTYRVALSDPDTSAEEMATVEVAVRPSLTVSAKPAIVSIGQKARLTIKSGLPNTTLTVSLLPAGETDYGTPVPFRTNSTGSSIRRVSVNRTTAVRVDYAGDPIQGWAPASSTTRVRARPVVSFAIKPTATYEGKTVRFSGGTNPSLAGQTVVIERRYTGGWKPWRRRILSSAARFSCKWVSSGRGTLKFRARIAATDAFAAGLSAARGVYLRNPNPYGVSRSKPRFIVVDRSQYKLYYHEYGRIKRVLPCVLGKPATRTPLGRYKITRRLPNTYGMAGAAMLFYRAPYAVHGTNQPWLLNRFPRGFSHGCTRVSNANILWLFSRCPVGTPLWNVP